LITLLTLLYAELVSTEIGDCSLVCCLST